VGTILVSYLGMRLWVFVQSSHFQRIGKSSRPERIRIRTLISRISANCGEFIVHSTQKHG